MAITVKIHSGLGNQMFQYALGRSLARQRRTELFLDVASFATDTFRRYGLQHFNVAGKFWSASQRDRQVQLRRKTYRPVRWWLQATRSDALYQTIVDDNRGYDERPARTPGSLYLDGYWQSELYFPALREVLLQDFTLKSEPDAANRELLARIMSAPAVCVHVRRGDYVNTAWGSEHLGACSLDYYRAALEHLRARFSPLEFFIFSDEPEWVRANFPSLAGATIVAHNAGRNDIEDFRLMMHCRHFIIANSTFSWWAAWLGRAPEKVVIAPQRWFASPKYTGKDLVPAAWVRL